MPRGRIMDYDPIGRSSNHQSSDIQARPGCRTVSAGSVAAWPLSVGHPQSPSGI